MEGDHFLLPILVREGDHNLLGGTVFGSQFWSGGLILAATFGPGGPLLGGTGFRVTGLCQHWVRGLHSKISTTCNRSGLLYQGQ